jgi:hypothetical protein
MIERSPQAPVVVILEGDKSKWLKYALRGRPHRTEDFGHTMHRSGLSLKCDFYKVALAQRPRQLQQSARRRNGLEFSFCVPAVFETDRSQDGIS